MPKPLLKEFLELASTGQADSLRGFYKCLLAANVFVPVHPQIAAGEATYFEHFASVEDGERKVLPVFSDEEGLLAWSKLPPSTRAFKSLIWLLPEDCWVHLDPGEEIGKEISPWELELLRRHGLDAIEELVAEHTAEIQGAVQLDADATFLADLKASFREILDVYERIEEAFLIRLTTEVADKGTTYLGLAPAVSDSDYVNRLQGELRLAAEKILPQEEELHIEFDIHQSKLPQAQLMLSGSPFYFHRSPGRDNIKTRITKWLFHRG